MDSIEFLAFGAYVRKVIRNDAATEADEFDKDNPPDPSGSPGLRCRVWSKASPSVESYAKEQTFLLDLAKHEPFTIAGIPGIRCDSPGLTCIGAGSGTGPSSRKAFEEGDDYVNTIYIPKFVHSNLPSAVRPVFPPLKSSDLPGRTKLKAGPEDYEFRSFVYATDAADECKRGKRYLGYYAEIDTNIKGSTWKVRVYKIGSEHFEIAEIDFSNDVRCDRSNSMVTGVADSYGSLFIENDYAAQQLHMGIPKLPPAAGTGFVPPVSLPLPSLEEIEALKSARGF